MNKDVQNTEYDVVSDNNQYVDEHTSDADTNAVYQEEVIDKSNISQVEENPNNGEVVYEEYIDADEIMEGYSEDGTVVYYTMEDGVPKEILYQDEEPETVYEEVVDESGNVVYQEVVYEDENEISEDKANSDDSVEDVVIIEQESENEEVILGDNQADDVSLAEDDEKASKNTLENVVENVAGNTEEKVEESLDKVVEEEKKAPVDTQQKDEKRETVVENKTENESVNTNSVFSQEEKSLTTDASVATKVADTTSVTTDNNQQNLAATASTAAPVEQLDSNNSNVNQNTAVQNNVNQVAMPQPNVTYPQQNAQGQAVNLAPQVGVAQVAVPVSQPVVSYPNQVQQFQQQQIPVVSQPAVPVTSQVYQTPVMQPQPTMVVAQPQIVSSVPINTGYPTATYPATGGVAPTAILTPMATNYQPTVQNMVGQTNTPVMYQAGSAAYAARGIPQVGQAAYQNTGAAQMGRTTAMVKPAATTAKSTNSSSDKSVYKKGHGFLKLLFSLAFLAILVLGAYIIFFRESNYTGSADVDLLFDPFKPIMVYQDDLVGYINSKGEFLIDPMFEEGTEFYGDYAAVLLDDVYKIINKEGDTVVTCNSSDPPVYDVDYNVWIIDSTLYDINMQDLAHFIKDGEYGFYSYVNTSKSTVGVVNNNGAILYSAAGTEIEVDTSAAYSYDAYALVHVANDKDAIISGKTNSVIYTAASNSIKSEGDAIFSVNLEGINKFLYFNDGQLVKEFDNVSDVNMFNYKKGILEVVNNGTTYYYDTINGVELDDADYNNSYTNEKYYGYEIEQCGEGATLKYSLMKDGEDVMSCEYDSIDFLKVEVHEFVKVRTLKEFVVLTKGTTTQLYDLTFKKVVLELENVVPQIDANSMFVVFSAKEDSSAKEDVVYSLLTGKTTTFAAGENYFIAGSNYFVTIDKNNLASYYNIKLEGIYEVSNYMQ